MLGRILLFLCLAFLLGRPVVAEAAGPALVFEASSGRVLYSEEPHRLWHPASLTKLMTAYLTFEELRAGKLKLNDKLICSAHANRQQASKIGLPVGAKISVSLALRTVIVKSANDVSVMLAEHISGTERDFVTRMNATAKRLGMARTRFANPNGLPDDSQVTTAHDMGVLARSILHDFPEYAHLFSLTKVKVGRRMLRGHNSLLRTFAGANGMKTGFICASGYNIVASAKRDGRQLIAVVLGSRTSGRRRLRTAKLLEFGFQNYLWKALFSSVNLDNLPFDSSAKLGPMNLRAKVRSCNYRARRIRKRRKRRLRKRIKRRKRKTVKRARRPAG